jgi:hypothetical protein
VSRPQRADARDRADFGAIRRFGSGEGDSRDQDKWLLTVDGYASSENLSKAMFPRIVPPGITVKMLVAVTDPIERGWFEIDGPTPSLRYYVSRRTEPCSRGTGSFRRKCRSRPTRFGTPG